MFYFIDFSGKNSSQTYDQGVLFEELVKKIIDALGFKIISMRPKISGKEYDIRAEAKLGGRLLIGEAKARRENQSISVITSFVGSLDHKELPDDTLGVFISISDITSDAKNWINNVKKRDRIELIVSNDIFTKLHEMGYQSINQIKKTAADQFDMRVGDTHFLVSNRGDFFIQTMARKNEARIKAFCVYNAYGNRIEEVSFGNDIKTKIDDFRDLVFLPKPQTFLTNLDDSQGRIGVDKEGAGWFEHKLPAHPDRFIGRIQQINAFIDFQNDVKNKKTHIKIYQVLSPSGVGKSSFLLKINHELGDNVTVLQDARNFRSTNDLLYLLQDFLEKGYDKFNIVENLPLDKSNILISLQNLDNNLVKQNEIGVIFVDQFESLFLRSDIYNEFVDILLEIIHKYENIIVCIARKNDHPTTFDEKDKIDISRLQQISKSIELKDFTSKEANELISHLSEEIQQQLNPKLKELILEFSASGFPWIIKRISAHIRDMVNKNNMSQNDLVQNGIRLEELFEEDLVGIDIIDREFLREIAQYLPATLDDLSQIEKFQGKLLSSKIRVLQDQRLIRLIGRTFDTYSDVFKHYLKHGVIPHQNKYTFRTSPKATIKVLQKILKDKPKTIDDLNESQSRKSGSMWNVLRELRMLSLVDYSRGELQVDEETNNAYENNSLEAHVKDRVYKNNGLVQDVLAKVTIEENIEIEDLIQLMQNSLPLLDLSEKTWDMYARQLVNWIRYLGLTSSSSFTSKGRSIGITKRGPKSDYYLPSSYIKAVISTIEKFKYNEILPTSEFKEIRWAKADCLALGLLQEKDENFVITKKGKKFLQFDHERPYIIKDFIMHLDYMPVYLDQIKAHSRDHLDVLKFTLGDAGFTEETWMWRSKILANWLIYSGIITRKAGKIILSSQPELF